MDIQDSDEVIKWAGGRPPVHPALLARAQMRAALASHDIGTVFRVLNANGWTQRQIAEAVRMHQSQVSEIIQGRRVREYRVLVRIADGLKIPRALMSLGPAESPSAYPGDWLVAVARAEVDEEMLRRMVLSTGKAAAAAIMAGRPVTEKSAPLPVPAPGPAPSRLLELHVMQVRHLTQRLEEDARTYGANPQVSSAAAIWASGLLKLPGAEETRRELMVAVAEIHLHAGRSAFDAGLYEHTLYHCNQTLELATEAGEAYFQTLALNWAGLATVEHGRPDDGLAMLQFGHFLAGGIPSEEQRPGFWAGSRVALRACALADSATALARMGDPKGAASEWAQARELYQPTAADPSTDLDYVAANLALEGQRLEEAESFAAASLRRWTGSSRRAWTRSGILLATIHVRVGESDGVELAHRAITSAARISSWRTRQYLIPLADALDARPSTDHRELSRLARQVATTRV